MRELVIKKCLKCGALVEVLHDCNCENCGVKCCGEEMKSLKANSVEAAVEKHVPQFEIKDNKIIVSVNHVMEEEHYIEWIAIVTENKIEKKILLPNEKAEAIFDYVDKGTVYAYCNKHQLWSNNVEIK